MTDIVLSDEQQKVVNMYLKGENVMLLGCAGVGKDITIRHIHRDAYAKCKDIHVCALTGCAAVLLECKARTLHSWAGIGLGSGTIEQNIGKVMKKSGTRERWRSTETLIVNEVSMMSQKLFEMLDAIGRVVRRCPQRPFGGIQLIFAGDVFQLPPVGAKEEPETMRFCFESPKWFETFPLKNHICLTKIFRQKDEIFQTILNQIREGRITKSSNELLLGLVGRPIPEDALIKPTKLFPTRNKVDTINSQEMAKITTPIIEYKIQYHDDLPMTAKEKLVRMQYTAEQIGFEQQYLKSNLRCDENVKLKIGAQVMCIVNIDLLDGRLLYNGSQGIITRLNHDGLPVVKYKQNGVEFEQPMGYHIWPSETIPGVGVSQVPLILSWAMTIHKSQGATLDMAEIDVGSGIFECGQTYVALSRVKSLDGLYLSSFDYRRIKVNKKVQDFYDMLREYAGDINRNKTEQDEKSYVEELEKKLIEEEKAEEYQADEKEPELEQDEIPVAIAVPIPFVQVVAEEKTENTEERAEIKTIRIDPQNNIFYSYQYKSS